MAVTKVTFSWPKGDLGDLALGEFVFFWRARFRAMEKTPQRSPLPSLTCINSKLVSTFHFPALQNHGIRFSIIPSCRHRRIAISLSVVKSTPNPMQKR